MAVDFFQRDVARLEKKLETVACLVGVSSQTTSDAASKTEQAGRRQAQNTSQLVLPREGSVGFAHENALVILTKYRTEMAYHCPCVVVPLDITLLDLQQNSPHLLSAILMVTSLGDADRKKRMTDQFLEHISYSIVKELHKGLDILQALLVCVSWYLQPFPCNFTRTIRGSRHNRYHFLFKSEEQLSVIMHLALAMLHRLGLHRRPAPSIGKSPQPREHDNAHTTDARRAYLGCFYITCVYVD